jgi:hypothetical protein
MVRAAPRARRPRWSAEGGTHAWVEVLVPDPARPGLLTVGVTSVEYGLTRG